MPSPNRQRKTVSAAKGGCAKLMKSPVEILPHKPDNKPWYPTPPEYCDATTMATSPVVWLISVPYPQNRHPFATTKTAWPFFVTTRTAFTTKSVFLVTTNSGPLFSATTKTTSFFQITQKHEKSCHPQIANISRYSMIQRQAS